MKDSLFQTKILFLTILLIPVLLITTENLKNIKIPEIGKDNPLAVYEIWDQNGKLHPEGPFTIEEFSSIVDEKMWFGYNKESDSIVIPDGIRLKEDLVRIVFDYISDNQKENQANSNATSKTFTDLIISLDREGIVEKTDSIINESSLKSYLLNNIAKFFWLFERNARNIPLTVLNSEIFYGKEGWIFSKNLSSCPSFYSQNKYKEILGKLNSLEKKIIILPIPLKGQIVEEKLLPFQRLFIGCSEVRVFNNQMKLFAESFEYTSYIDLFPVYLSQKNLPTLFSQGNTHWSDYGLSIALVELLSSMDTNSLNEYKKEGSKLANNEVLERLGLISLSLYEDDYVVYTSTDFSNEKILLIRDSFFENRNGGDQLKELFDYDEVHWSYIEKISPEIFISIIDNYSIIIIESSIENLLYFSSYGQSRLEILSRLLP